MRTVELEVLKGTLAECVQLASKGERVLITVSGRVVAELVPSGHGRADEDPAAELGRLVREGLVTPPLSPGRPLTVAHSRGAKLADLLAELGEDRNDR